MRPGQDSAEQIRRHEVSRALKKVDLSPEEEEVIERLSCSLVRKVLYGPISEVMERVETELSFGGDEVGRHHVNSKGTEVKLDHPGRRPIRSARTAGSTSSAS